MNHPFQFILQAKLNSNAVYCQEIILLSNEITYYNQGLAQAGLFLVSGRHRQQARATTGSTQGKRGNG